MSAHSPGPWGWQEWGEDGMALLSPGFTGQGRTVMRIVRGDAPERADARLIAAAPALLEALRPLARGCSCTANSGCQAAAARALIKQIES